MAKRRDDSWHPLFLLLSLSLFFSLSLSSFCLYPRSLYAIFIAVSSSSSSCQLIANTFDVLFTRCVISSIDKWRNGEKEMKDGKKRKRERDERRKKNETEDGEEDVKSSCSILSGYFSAGLERQEKERERVWSCYSRRKIGGEIILPCATSILFLTPGALVFEAFASKMVLFSLPSSFFSSLVSRFNHLKWLDFLATTHQIPYSNWQRDEHCRNTQTHIYTHIYIISIHLLSRKEKTKESGKGKLEDDEGMNFRTGGRVEKRMVEEIGNKKERTKQEENGVSLTSRQEETVPTFFTWLSLSLIFYPSLRRLVSSERIRNKFKGGRENFSGMDGKKF